MVLRSVGCPAAVDGQDGAGEIAGLRVGEQEAGAGDLAGRGPPAQGDLGGQESSHLRIIVHAGVEGRAERARC